MEKISFLKLMMLFFAVSAFTAVSGEQAQAGASGKIEPVLAPNPVVMAKLKALGQNSCVVFDRTGIIEDLGDFAKGWHNMKKTGPRSRDYTTKMAYMPDRKRAFFCGANHGSPHRFNDAWEFDLPSCTWVLLYVPDYNDKGKITEYDKKTLVVKDGWLRTRKGGPGHPAHTWSGLTYDPKLKAAVWYCYWPSYRLDAKLKAIGKTQADLYKGPPIWVFYPAKKKWQPMPTAKPWPSVKYAAASMEYVPDLGGSLLLCGNKASLLNGEKRSWTPQSVKGQALRCYSTLVCYDPGRKLLIAHKGLLPREGSKVHALPETWHGSVVNGSLSKWEKVVSLGNEAAEKWKKRQQGSKMPEGHEIRSFLYFDPVGKVALNFEMRSKAIWSYDPDIRKWTKQTPKGPPPPFSKRERILAYMDLARNVFVVIGYKKVWCYRFKRIAK